MTLGTNKSKKRNGDLKENGALSPTKEEKSLLENGQNSDQNVSWLIYVINKNEWQQQR